MEKNTQKNIQENIPESFHKNVYIKTFGCSLNQSDTELMSGLLEEAGFNVINNFGLTGNEWKKHNEKNPEAHVISDEDFDVIIINTCTVKNLAEKKFEKEFHKWQGKPMVVTGCIPQAEPGMLNGSLKHVSVLGTRQLTKIVGVVNHTLKGEVIHDLSDEAYQRLNLPKIRKSDLIEIIPICEGCLSNCTYCKTKFSRGELLSYDRQDIILQFKTALSDGCREFWITSQDNGCYGFDRYRPEKYFLPQLLTDLLSIDGNFRIRLGMANPDHIKRIKKDLIGAFKHPKMFKFLHMPIQSGNDRVLKSMKRFYTVKDYVNIVNDFKEEIPGITISTDIIVGFPGEADTEFDDTISLLEKTRPDVINLSRFWLRKGTAAEKLSQVNGGISKKRSKIIKKTFNAIAKLENKKWIGRIGTALIDEIGKNDTLIARNDYYKQIIIKNPGDHAVGEFVKILITDSRDYDLVGQIID